MKKIGQEVFFLKTGKGNPRNGESTMLRLADGRILFAFTEYRDDNRADHAEANISACYSADEGETWTSPAVILKKPKDAQNIMSPSLIRLTDGAIGMIYLRKDVHADRGVTCMPFFIRSENEGKTWGESVPCGFPLGYYCAVNDSALVTRDGRIYVITSYTGPRRDVLKQMDPPPIPHPSDIRLTYSDDNGKTWTVHPKIFHSPYEDRHGLYEPGLFEHEDGTLWMYARTCFGHQYQSLSYDRGETWTPVEPNFRFTTPDSPMRVKRVGRYVAAVYNPMGYNCMFPATEAWGCPKRTPIVVSLSDDDGKSLNDPSVVPHHGGFRQVARNTYFLEDDLSDSYCYPSILEVRDGFLVSYYHSDGNVDCLNASKLVKVRYDELT